jgi:hypothetical protein
MVILLISSIYFFSNYNKNRIYYISGKSTSYYTNGYFILSPERNLLIIRDIEYSSSTVGTNDEPNIASINISVFLNDLALGSYSNDYSSKDATDNITTILKNISFVVDDKTIGELSVNDNTNIRMVIEYIEKNGNYDTQEIALNLNKIFSSDKLIYT